MRSELIAHRINPTTPAHATSEENQNLQVIPEGTGPVKGCC